jgi:hypothetical protein
VEDEVIVLTADKRQAALVCLIGLVFLAGGIGMVRYGKSGGWFVLVFFGLCFLMSLYMLLPNSIRLTIDKNGNAF